MSTIPSRTRSLRKPAENEGRYGRSSTVDPKDNGTILRPAASDRSNQSPSRLPTVTTRTTRSTSTIARPLSSSGTSTKPSIKPPSARANTSKPATTELQRRPSTSSRNGNPASNTEPVKQDRSRPPVTQSRHLRNASISSTSTLPASARTSGHVRNKSSSSLLGVSTVLKPPPRASEEPTPRTSTFEHPQLKKPAFSTLQQHFSPAKSLAPKPHPAAFLAPPSPSKLPSNIAISAETAKLQNELLQLHLLHKDAASVDRQWRASAKKKLGARFQGVVKKNDVLVQSEVDETGKVNAAALRKWKEAGTPGWGLDEKVQVLDEVVTGVWNLGESGGKYGRVVRRFERWLSRCQGILAARESEDGVGDVDVVFVEELDGAWKDDCLILGKKLETWRDQLRGLEAAEKGSSLAAVGDGCRSLVKGMLTELSVMSQIERDVMKREREWIKSMNDDVSDDEKDMLVAGACWRSR